MRVLIVGSSGIENAIAWKLAVDNSAEMVFVAPGNPGIAKFANCIDINETNVDELVEFAKENLIDFTIVSSKEALEKGIVNSFKRENLTIFGPVLESQNITSKRSYAKKFCYKNKIPMTKFGVFEKESQAVDFLKSLKYPVAIKLDSQIPDVNTYVCETFSKSRQLIEQMFLNNHKRVIIEEYEHGKDITISIVTDGYDAVPLPMSVSYLNALDSDGGQITNGVGAYAPCNCLSLEQESEIANNIVFPVLDAMNAEHMSYTGILTFRVKLTNKGHILLSDIDCTLGNPDAQAILPLLEDDLLRILYSTVIGALADDYESFRIKNEYTVSTMLLSGAYPFEFKKGYAIDIDETIDDDILVFHNKTAKNSYFEVVTTGGRPISLTAAGSTLNIARSRLYDNIDCVDFENKRYRKDIAMEHVVEL